MLGIMFNNGGKRSGWKTRKQLWDRSWYFAVRQKEVARSKLHMLCSKEGKAFTYEMRIGMDIQLPTTEKIIIPQPYLKADKEFGDSEAAFM